MSPELSACCTDRQSPGWDGLLAHYWDCTAVQLLKSMYNRNRTTPCWYHDFDCVWLWPKYLIFGSDSIVTSSLKHANIVSVDTFVSVFIWLCHCCINGRRHSLTLDCVTAAETTMIKKWKRNLGTGQSLGVRVENLINRLTSFHPHVQMMTIVSICWIIYILLTV